jgi:uncharacterized membrane protein YfcA
VGLVPGTFAATVGYRAELVGQGDRIRRLAPASVLGTLLGCVALLAAPSAVFDAVVPVLIVIAVAAVVLQPLLSRGTTDGQRHREGPWLWLGVFAAGIYGGYFGAAQGILLIALLGTLIEPVLQRANALKNALATFVNAVAAVVFVFVAPVDWKLAGLLAVGTTIGAAFGSRVARLLPEPALRLVIVLVGAAAVVSVIARSA